MEGVAVTIQLQKCHNLLLNNTEYYEITGEEQAHSLDLTPKVVTPSEGMKWDCGYGRQAQIGDFPPSHHCISTWG